MRGAGLNILLHADILPHLTLPVGEVFYSGDFDIAQPEIEFDGVGVEFEYAQFYAFESLRFDLFFEILHGLIANAFAAPGGFADGDADPDCARFFFDQVNGIKLVVDFADQLSIQVDEVDLVIAKALYQVFYCDRLAFIQIGLIAVGAGLGDEVGVVFPAGEGCCNFGCGLG